MFQRPEDRYDDQVLDDIRRGLQPFTDEQLTREDAAEIASNVARYLELLRRWADERRPTPEPERPAAPASPEEDAHA